MKTFLLILNFWTVLSFCNTKVAITVDDLPTHGNLPPGITREGIAIKMLAIFKKHKIPEAYAFINAGKVEKKNQSFEVLKLWQAAGYSFGNHSYLHEDLHQTKVSEFTASIAKNETMLKKLSHLENWRYFRYPFLHEGDSPDKRNAIRNYLKTQGYSIAQVTIDFNDWSWNDPYALCIEKKNSQAIKWLEKTFLQNADDQLDRAITASRSLFKRDISHILLLHIGAFDAEVMDKLLTNYEKKGVEFISLEEAAKEDIYDFDPGVTGKWGAEFPYQVMHARHLTLKDIGLIPYTGYPEEELNNICK